MSQLRLSFAPLVSLTVSMLMGALVHRGKQILHWVLQAVMDMATFILVYRSVFWLVGPVSRICTRHRQVSTCRPERNFVFKLPSSATLMYSQDLCYFLLV